MKWILLVLVISFNGINCNQSDLKNGQHTISTGNVPTTRHRSSRTLGFDSKDESDDSGIHLHFWNDMNNQENYYPNLMKYITAEAVNKDLKPPQMQQSSDDSNSIHINLNEILPQPQSQQSPKVQLKNALANTLGLDEFRKSDQNLYGTYYKLNADRYKQNPFSWNYHPSAINYIPKVYDTNLNNAAAQSTPSIGGGIQRSTLYDQMYGTKHFIQDYYTNLHKNKPKSVIDAVGYEIGGLPKYSGRLLANEPMPQQYRTFKMFEPVPRQIMLPPPSTRIPDFKPVPPRLKVIPVIDEYLESRPNPITIPNSLPWTVIKPDEKLKPSYTNYLYPVPTAPVQIIPFKLSEAITNAPIRKFIPKTEFNYIEPSTESYYKQPNQFNGESVSPTMASKLNAYLPIQINQKHTNVDNSQFQHTFQPMNEPILNNGYHNDSKLQVLTNEAYTPEYMTNINHLNNNNVGAESHTFISTEDSRSTLNRKKPAQQFNNDSIVEQTKRNGYKKVKIRRKPQRIHEKITNDVIKLNVTGFRNVSQDDNRMDKNGDNDRLKKESDVDKLKLHASHEYGIDSVSADSIQLSQTYSRQTTNVPHPNPTPILASREQDSLLMQLANDVKKALLTSLGNDTNDNRFDDSYEMKQKDPFLITVFDPNDRTKYDAESRLGDDLQLAETVDRSNSMMRNATNGAGNNSIQRIDHDWTTSDQDKKPTVSKRDERIHDDDNNNHRHHNSDIQTAHDVAKNVQNHTTIETQNNDLNSTFINSNYYKWFSGYAEKNKKLGRTVISEHFKKVEIEPNISFVLPRKENMSTKTEQEKVDRLKRSGENETISTVAPIKCGTTCTSKLPQNNDPIS